MRFLALEKLINLRDGYRRRFKVDSLDVLLLQEQGELHIIQRDCPHRSHPLDRADVRDGAIYCTAHQFGFNLRSGQSVNNPCPALKVYTPVYEGTEVGVVVADS